MRVKVSGLPAGVISSLGPLGCIHRHPGYTLHIQLGHGGHARTGLNRAELCCCVVDSSVTVVVKSLSNSLAKSVSNRASNMNPSNRTFEGHIEPMRQPHMLIEATQGRSLWVFVFSAGLRANGVLGQQLARLARSGVLAKTAASGSV